MLKIPYPTSTPAPPPTDIPNQATQTALACEKVQYTVQENDTLGIISANYNVPQDAIKFYNGLSSDNVFIGSTIIIPLCERFATPGPTPTATPPPPYPAANLLLPPDGAAFTLANDVVTLQWASIGTLRDNEASQVTKEDVTAGQGRSLTDYVTDTKYIVPTSFRPEDGPPRSEPLVIDDAAPSAPQLKGTFCHITQNLTSAGERPRVKGAQRTAEAERECIIRQRRERQKEAPLYLD